MLFREVLMAAASQGGGAPSYDPLAVTYFAAVVTAGGAVSAARKRLVSDLIAGIRADGDLASIDELLLLCAEDAPGALTDVIASRAATAVNSPTFTANQGYAGNGTTSYVNTNWNPATQGTAYTRNSAHIMIYVRNARTSSVAAWNAGNSDNVTVNTLIGVLKDSMTKYRINSAVGVDLAPSADASGIWIMNRSTSLASQMYRAGSSVGSSGADASLAPASYSLFIGGANGAGAFGNGLTDQHGLFAGGGSLSSAAALRMTNRYQTFLTGVGA